ncbi:hypothetical protein Dimus_006155 [Dionaea muscipula]
MSSRFLPFDPNTSMTFQDAASLAIVVLAPYGTTSNPISDIPSSSNATPEVDQFDIEIELSDVLKARIRAGDQWDVADLIAPELLVKAGLATTPVDFSSLSLRGSPKPPPQSAPDQNDPSSSMSPMTTLVMIRRFGMRR